MKTTLPIIALFTLIFLSTFLGCRKVQEDKPGGYNLSNTSITAGPQGYNSTCVEDQEIGNVADETLQPTILGYQAYKPSLFFS